MSSATKKPRMVSCPQCGAVTPWNPANPYRPFCSERCKLIDLGQWATEAYRIPQENADDGQSEADER